MCEPMDTTAPFEEKTMIDREERERELEKERKRTLVKKKEEPVGQAVLVEEFGTRHPAIAILTTLWSVVCTRQVFSAFDSGELFAYIYLLNASVLGSPPPIFARGQARDCMQ